MRLIYSELLQRLISAKEDSKAQHQVQNQQSSFHRHSQVDTTETLGSLHVKVGKPYERDKILDAYLFVVIMTTVKI